MPAEKLYSEILDEFQSAKTKEQRIGVLRKYDHPRWRSFLQAAFHPGIVFDVEIPKYRPAVEPAGMNFAYLDSEMLKMYRFVKNHPSKPNGLSPEKQKQLLLVVLESLHKDESELLVKMMNKDLKVKFLTTNLVNEAYPGLL
ncbi:MAG: DUF6433 family protein [Flavobacteriales bacterium]